MEILSNNASWIFSGVGASLVTVLVTGAGAFFLGRSNRPDSNPAFPDPAPWKRTSAEELLIGNWKGKTTETERENGQKHRYDVTWHFYKKNGKLVCDSPATAIVDGQEDVSDYHLHVRIISERFFMIDFYNLDKKTLNFGSEVMELSDNGRAFSGRFVAYSPDEKEIISGKIRATRVGD